MQKLMLPGILLCSGPEFEPYLLPFLGSIAPLPAVPASIPVSPSAPNRHCIPLMKILLTGYQVVMGLGAIQGLGEIQGGLVSFPS